jgi:plasmid stabilization system protein ParE
MKYRLTQAAVKDVREIVQHIRVIQNSLQNAHLVAARLKHQFEVLLEIPLLGHRRSELQDDGALVIEVSGVLVIYDPKLRPLTVLRVIHGSRDLHRIRTRKR